MVRVLCAVFICSFMSNSLRPHRLYSARLLCPWGFSRHEYYELITHPQHTHRYRYRHTNIHWCKCRSSIDQMARSIRILMIQSFWRMLLILLFLFWTWRVIFLLMCSRKSLNSLNMMWLEMDVFEYILLSLLSLSNVWITIFFIKY